MAENQRLSTQDIAQRREDSDGEARSGGNGDAARSASTGDRTRDGSSPLFDENVSTDFRERWESVQSEFVDQPREAVKKADELVAEVMQQLAAGFADERKSLEGQWSKGDSASTEDLRVALQRYRSFFQRLLNV